MTNHIEHNRINILEYQYGSDKGQAKEGQVFSSPLAYNGMNPSYSSSYIDGETVDAATDTYTLKWQPAVANTVVVRDGATGAVKEGITTSTDDNGNLVLNGKLAEGDQIFYRYNNEQVPVDSAKIKLDIRSLPVETRSRKLSAIWSFDAQYELTKEYGQDLQQLLAVQATAEIAQEIDTEIILDLYRAANAGPEIVWSRMQPVGVSLTEHYDSFGAKIVEGSNQIFAATKRAHANFLVGGINVASVLQVMRNFTASEDLTAIGPHYIGTISGIRCYVSPNLDPDSFVLGYKGPSMIDAGLTTEYTIFSKSLYSVMSRW